MSKHAILAAAKDLLWETGYEAMSPRLVMDRSVTGQGSLYHHFKSKSALAAAALEEIAEELTAALDAAFDPARPPLARIEAYLRAERDGLKGCRLGRLANETAVLATPALRHWLKSYFEDVERRLARALSEAQAERAIRPDLPTALIASTLVASVQGGFALSRAEADPTAIHRATEGAWALLCANAPSPT